MTPEQYQSANGFSNAYWGYGGEDDDFEMRVRFHANLSIAQPSDDKAPRENRPSNLGKYSMISHEPDKGNPVNNGRLELLNSWKDRVEDEGVKQVQYNIVKRENFVCFEKITVNIGPAPRS